MRKELIDIVYNCTTPGCNNTQTIRYWSDEAPLPATCCVKCHAGFGSQMNYNEMGIRGVGMLPELAAA